MNSFAKFKEIIDYTSQELEKLTGYTRQGLHYGFRMISKGRMPSKQFLTCINVAIEKKIQEENEKHEAVIKKLKELQESLGIENNLQEDEYGEI